MLQHLYSLCSLALYWCCISEPQAVLCFFFYHICRSIYNTFYASSNLKKLTWSLWNICIAHHEPSICSLLMYWCKMNSVLQPKDRATQLRWANPWQSTQCTTKVRDVIIWTSLASSDVRDVQWSPHGVLKLWLYVQICAFVCVTNKQKLFVSNKDLHFFCVTERCLFF